jgi:hypothetical protein
LTHHELHWGQYFASLPTFWQNFSGCVCRLFKRLRVQAAAKPTGRQVYWLLKQKTRCSEFRELLGHMVT